MENAVDKLEALVRKAETDLKFMSCKLENELSNAASKDIGHQLNPTKTIEALKETKMKYNELLQQYQELQQAQKDAYESLSEEVQIACKNLVELEERSGVPVNTGSSIFTPLPNKRPD